MRPSIQLQNWSLSIVFLPWWLFKNGFSFKWMSIMLFLMTIWIMKYIWFSHLDYVDSRIVVCYVNFISPYGLKQAFGNEKNNQSLITLCHSLFMQHKGSKMAMVLYMWTKWLLPEMMTNHWRSQTPSQNVSHKRPWIS